MLPEQVAGDLLGELSVTEPAEEGPDGEINHYSPEATLEEMQNVPLEQLVEEQRLGRLDQSGHLLMTLDQDAADFIVVRERTANVPTGIDYAHDVLHRLALRIVEETYSAERYGHGPAIRWATTTAALEFRDAGQQLLRLSDLIVDNLVRDSSEPRTAPPSTATMCQHYRNWATRWRGGFGQIIQGVLQHREELHRRQHAELQAREEHESRLAELRELERMRATPPTGPDPGMGVRVAKRPWVFRQGPVEEVIRTRRQCQQWRLPLRTLSLLWPRSCITWTAWVEVLPLEALGPQG